MKRLAQAYLTESRWFHSNHIPTVEEYMEVAIVTSTYAMLTTVSFLGMEETTEEVLIWTTSHPKIIEAASLIGRLMDDIAGSEVYFKLPLLFLFSTLYGCTYLRLNIFMGWESHKIYV